MLDSTGVPAAQLATTRNPMVRHFLQNKTTGGVRRRGKDRIEAIVAAEIWQAVTLSLLVVMLLCIQ